MSWNKYHEELLKRWSEMSKTYSIMHSLCAQYYSTWHKRLGIPVVILGGITASSIFSTNKDNAEIWSYVNGGMALIVTILAGVTNFLGTSEKTIKHQNASFKYSKIGMDIDTMLSFSRDERILSPQEFIYTKKTEFLEIRENVPEVLSWVTAEYIKKLDKTLTDTKSRVNENLTIKTPPTSEASPGFDTKTYIPPQTRGMVRPPTMTKLGTFSQPRTSIGNIGLQMSTTNRSFGNTMGIAQQRYLGDVELQPSKRRNGELLVDFSDKSTVKMLKLNEHIQGIHNHPELSESDSESEDLELPAQRPVQPLQFPQSQQSIFPTLHDNSPIDGQNITTENELEKNGQE